MFVFVPGFAAEPVRLQKQRASPFCGRDNDRPNRRERTCRNNGSRYDHRACSF
jgi:hypothetical protein